MWASSSSTLNFETGLDDTYDAFELRLSSMKPATDDVQILLRVKVSGSYQTTGYLSALFVHTSAAASALSNSTTSIPMCFGGGGGGVGNAAGENLSGCARFSNPELTTDFMQIDGDSSHRRADNLMSRTVFGGYFNTVGAVTGVQVLASSGNLASGRVSLYGLKKA